MSAGPVQVLGFHDDNPTSDGRQLPKRYLSYLAHHPATAHRVARKLAVIMHRMWRDGTPFRWTAHQA